MSSRFHNNAIWVQLDLLFEFCQWAIGRFAFPEQTHVTLYRGVNAFDDTLSAIEQAQRCDPAEQSRLLYIRPQHCHLLRGYDPYGTGSALQDRVLQRPVVLASAQGRRRVSGGRRRVPCCGRVLLTGRLGMTALTVEDRALAAYLGFAIGDALGATVEFMTKRRLPLNMASIARSRAVAGCGSSRDK